MVLVVVLVSLMWMWNRCVGWLVNLLLVSLVCSVVMCLLRVLCCVVSLLFRSEWLLFRCCCILFSVWCVRLMVMLYCRLRKVGCICGRNCWVLLCNS